VVGYATYLYYPQPKNGTLNRETPQQATQSQAQQPNLPSLVRRHLEQKLAGGEGENLAHLVKKFPTLNKKGASFITLTKKGQLRGCIGSLVAHRPLVQDLLSNGFSAAINDPRFPAVTKQELAELKVEVSLLSEPEPLLYRDGEDLLTLLKPGIHGVILQKGSHRSTFLPQVWDQIPDPVTFLSHLCQKAGLSGDCWKNNPQISTYTVEKTKEP
jgi:AmmeMemoRadiSam system protein A